MAFVDNIHSFEAGLVRRMRNSFDMARKAASQRRAYRKTLRELQALSPRELDDLGIHGSNIAEVARSAAYAD